MVRASATTLAPTTERTRAYNPDTDRAAAKGRRKDLARLGSIDDRERQFHLLVGAVQNQAIYMLDANGFVVSWNAGAERIKGYTEDEIVGENFANFYTDADQFSGEPANSLRIALEHGRFEAEAQRVRKDGSLFWAHVVIFPIYDDNAHHIGFAKLTRDVTERHKTEERLFRLAHFDSLTQLPNRVSIQAGLDKLLDRGRPVAVLMLDLDGFKATNDTLGHSAGDAILASAAHRIRACIAERGEVGRWGGDEFVVLLPDDNSLPTAKRIAAELIESFRPVFAWEEHEFHLGLSIGICIASRNSLTDEILANADLALYQAKSEGPNTFSLYEPKLREALQSRRELERELRDAVTRGEFELFYQPQIDLANGNVVGAEALLRWRHPRRGLLSPSAFIPTLEHMAIAHMVGDWAVREATAFAARARARIAPDFRVAVNLFAAQFRKGQLVPVIRKALHDNALSARALELEITENIVLRRDAEMLKPLRELHELGVGIAFDDYGTGHASLSLLKRYPLTMLKIDKGFVRSLCTNREDEAVVRAILHLAKSFGLHVVAEGIETEEQSDILRSLECQYAQGFLYGRPMPADELLASLDVAQDE
jgi:diguanylate cyclase (GGDEF)-like protein/PAS domain S-box-containing protein